MARAFARWSGVRSLQNPSGWVYRVGLNWATSWWRKRRREQPMPATHELAAADDPQAAAALAAVRELPLAPRAVVVCRVLLDLSIVETAIPTGDCQRYGESLSPDGDLLAMVQPAPDGANTGQLVVVVIDVTTGAELVHEVVDESPDASNGGELVYGGVCWSDADHVRAVWFRLPAPAVRMYTKAETLRQAIVPVPGR